MDGLLLNMEIYPYCERYGLTTVAIQVQDLLNYTKIDPMVQRKLSAGQRRKIASYLQERELDRIFFGPVTLSLRDVSQLTKQPKGLLLRHGHKVSILDGQHRILALGFVNERMQKEVNVLERKIKLMKVKCRKHPEDLRMAEELDELEGLLEQLEVRRLDLLESELSVQLYIGLNEEEEKQLFGDINSKVQLVSKELGHLFDSTDPINSVIQQVADHNNYLKATGIERRNNLTAYNKNFTCFSWLYSTASLLFNGTMQPSYELMRRIRADVASHVEVLHQFLNAVIPHMPEQPGQSKFVSSNRMIQESIALYAHRYLYHDDVMQQGWVECLKVLDQFDWTQDNEAMITLFGQLDNGKLNLVHEKSLRKHTKFVDYLASRLEIA
jgi:hypothetical protein